MKTQGRSLSLLFCFDRVKHRFYMNSFHKQKTKITVVFMVVLISSSEILFHKTRIHVND